MQESAASERGGTLLEVMSVLREVEGKMEAKLEMALAKQREHAPAQAQELIPAPQLAALQRRLEALHSAQLLSEEELHTLEDLCADYLALKPSATVGFTPELISVAATLSKLISLSEGMAADGSFARQARRKFT